MSKNVVINEVLELAKNFGAAESFKFINGVLDKMLKDGVVRLFFAVTFCQHDRMNQFNKTF